MRLDGDRVRKGSAWTVAVLGPGAIGGLLAGLLARDGHRVICIARSSTADALRCQGLSVRSGRFGDFRVPVEVQTELRDSVDACLVTVKATQVEEALERVPVGSLGRSLVVPFLNGIDHIDLLRRTYPLATVVAATIRVEVARESGLIRHTSPFALVEIARRVTGPDRAGQFAAELSAAGLDVHLRGDEAAMLWDKLAFLAPLALLTTHDRGNVGAIRTRRREDTLAVISEVAAVARAEGAAVDAEAVLSLLDSVPEAMQSSMQRDQAAGLPLELDAIGGAVLRRAARAGIHMPVTGRIVQELRDRTLGLDR